MAGSQRGDVDVVFAVVVKIADGATHTVHLDSQASLAGAVSEGSVSVVVIESGVILPRGVARPIHGIHEQNVLESIVIVVEYAHTAAHSLGKVFLSEGAAMMTEGNARCSRSIDKMNWPGRTRR